MTDIHNTPRASRPYCPDCGPAGVSHAVERWSVRLDTALGYVQYPAAVLWQTSLRPIVSALRPGRIVPYIAQLFAALRLGTIAEHPDDKNNLRAQVIWQEAERRGIVMREFRPFGLSREIFYATYHGDTRGFDGLPRPRNAHESSLDWMDDKGVILKKFRDAGVPMPRGRSVKTIVDAEKVFYSIVPKGDNHDAHEAVIVKPAIGSRSRHTYIGITDINALRHAFFKAQELCPRVVVEEELHGFVFRVTLVGGAIAGVMRREPPHVIGDGAHTIHELVTEENKNPLRKGPIFHEIQINEETSSILAEQHLSLDAIPERGRMVIIHPKVSRAYGASTTELATNEIHPDNQTLFLHIAKVLDDPLVGVDFMIEDMARSWKEQRSGVIECNSLPFIDLHHYPLKGPSANVAGMIWELVFPGSGNNPSR